MGRSSLRTTTSYDAALRVNAEGTGRLMSRFRAARACLVMSTCGVYASPEDPHRAILESDLIHGRRADARSRVRRRAPP